MPRRTPPSPPAFPVPTKAEVVECVLALINSNKEGVLYQVDDAGWHSKSDPDPTSALPLYDGRPAIRVSDAKLMVADGIIEQEPNVSPVRYRLTAGVTASLELSPYNVREVVETTLNHKLFHPSLHLEGRTAIPYTYTPSQSNSRLVLVLGANASGKSLFRRIMRLTTTLRTTQEYGPEIPDGPHPVREFLHASMQARTTSGIATAMIYGDESRHSTGQNSAHSVSGVIRNANLRPHTNIIYFDEPDIGMSAGASAGAGMEIGEYVQNGSNLTRMVCVTSHTPALVRRLAACDPHIVYLGDTKGPTSIDAWVLTQLDPEPVSSQELQALANNRYRDIQAVLDEKPRIKK